MAFGSKLKTILISAVTLIAVIALLVVIAYLMLTHQPSSYAPRVLTAEEKQQVRTQADLKAAELYNRVHELQPFVISIDEKMINDLLLHDDTQHYWQQVIQRSGGRLGLPQVNFQQGVIEMMVLIEHEGTEAVLSVGITPTINGDGELLVRLSSLHAGAMPLPKSLLQSQLRQVLDALADASALAADGGMGDEEAEVMLGAVDDLQGKMRQLVDNSEVTMPADLPVDTARTARITQVEVTEDQVRFQVQPLAIN